MSETFEYDVFLSYSRANEEAVGPLAERLRDAGLRVWFDRWVLKPGDSIPLGIQRGLEQSRVLVLCMSEAYFRSEWATVESLSVLFRDPTNEARRFIPLRLDDVEAPSLIAHYLYVDWREPTAVAFRDLAAACEGAGSEKARPEEGSRHAEPSAPSLSEGRSYKPKADQTVLEGHKGQVNSVSVAADGARAVSGGDDRTVRVWDLSAGACEAVLGGHTGWVSSVAVTPDGTRAVSGGSDGVVRVWDLMRGVCDVVLGEHRGGALCVSVTPDGTRAVSGGSDGVVRVWDLMRGVCDVALGGHEGTVRSVSVAADGARAVSGGDDRTVRVWDLSAGACEAVLEGHASWIRGVSVTADGTRAVSGGNDRTVRVWDLSAGACEAVLEGHESMHKYGVLDVSVTGDGLRAVSGGGDGTVRVWDLSAGACEAVLEGHGGLVRSVSVTGDGLRAVSGGGDGTVRVWDLGLGGRTEGYTRYTNAKVALVGESGVGKSGLRIRLTEDAWRETESTHGMDVRRLDLPGLGTDDMEREVWLWDFAGQPDYRLVHQLYMDETALALIVIDPQRDDPFAPLAHWEKALEVTGRTGAARLLVAARCDRGGFTVSDAAIERYLAEHAYAGWIKTAAKTGQGCDRLRDLIAEHVDWDRLPYTATTALFKTLKDTVLTVRQEGVPLLQVAALQQRLRMALPDVAFDEAELRTVVGLLAGQGLVHVLPFGDFVLLRPELVNDYASAVVRAAREDIDEIGTVAERDVLEARIPLVGVERLSAADERHLLRDLVQIFLDRSLCIREETEQGTMLVFPSYFRRQRPEAPERPDVVVTYRFSGPLDEIYATLVVRLHYTEAFEKEAFWRYAADFKTTGDRLAGVYLEKLDEGRAEIRVHFGEGVPAEVQVAFIRYVHTHLHRKATDIVRVRMHRCPEKECGEPLDPERARAALERGRDSVRCDECDRKVPLVDLIEERFESPEVLAAVRKMDEQAEVRLDTESLELILVGQAMSVAATAGQIFRPMPVADHGIDGEIEFKTREGKASGRRVYLQLKSGDSHLRHRKRDDAEVFTITKPRHAEYWTSQPAPVMLVVRTSDGTIRWMDISAYLDEHGPDTKRVIFDGEPFTPTSVVALRDRILAGT